MSESSENFVTDQTLEVSGSIETSDGGIDGKENEGEDTPKVDLGFSSGEGVIYSGLDANSLKSSELEQSSVLEMPVSTEEESSGFVDSESPDFKTETESIINDEEPSSLHADHNNEAPIGRDESLQDDPEDENQTEDAGKEEAFVDAQEELVVGDGRNADIVDPELNSEIQEKLEEKSYQLMDEVAQLRAMLDKTADEKEIMAQRYEEEREMITREFANLHQQIEVMSTNEQPFLIQNDNGHDWQNKTHVSDTPMEVMVSDCNKFVALLKSALNEQLKSEETIRELHAILFTKDQEIEDLSTKVTEFSVSHDVVVSSLKESSEGQLERDRHLEAVTKRLLDSLSTVIQPDNLSDHSVAERLSLVEKGTSQMIQNYNEFLSEVNGLSRCLTEVGLDFTIPDNELGIVFNKARDELLECKRKELDFVERLNQHEDEHKKLLEQLEREKERVQVVTAEANKTSMELEQEKIKSATTKEKLSLAVTKGKALVQQRDSLKQALAEKSNEVERCVHELQEKSNALEVAELKFVESQDLATSLNESFMERDTTLKDIYDILFQIDTTGELRSLDIIDQVRWLVDQKHILENVSLEYHEIVRALSSIDLPETILADGRESQINWLWESFCHTKGDIIKFQVELAEARNEIDSLTASLSAEKQEKSTLQIGLEDLSCKYEAIVEKEFRASSEKDRIMRKFLEVSGVDDQEWVDHSDMDMLIKKCVGKIEERINDSSESSRVDMEKFEGIQRLLYVRNQELTLCEEIVEEDMLVKGEITNLSEELQRVSQEVVALKGEKDSLLKDLERSEEKSRAEITNLSEELERVSREVVALKDEKDSLLKDLERSEEKSILLREKLSMAVKKGKGIVQEREGLKRSLDDKNTEIEKLKLELQQQESAVNEGKDEINRLIGELGLISKLESDLADMKAQRDQLEQFLLESNRMLQRVMESIESIVLPVDAVFKEPVEKVKWLATCFNNYQSKFTEACITIKSLEEALSVSENNISVLTEETKASQVDKARAEKELEKAKEAAFSEASKLEESYLTIKSLEDALSQVEKNVSVLVKEKNDAQVGKTSLENELGKVKDALSQAESNISELVKEKRSAEEEIITINAKLSTCMEELTGTHGSLESRSVELLSHLNHLDMLMKDEDLSSSLTQGFKKKFKSLREMHLVLESIQGLFVEKGSDPMRFQIGNETDPFVEKPFPAEFENVPNGTINNSETSAADLDGISSYFVKILEGFNMKNKLIKDKSEGFFSSMDELFVVMLRALQATRDEVILVFESMESLKLKLENFEAYNQAQEATVSTLQNDLTMLLSACTDVAEELQFDVDVSNPSSSAELEKLEQERVGSTECVKAAEKLLLAARKNRIQTKQFENIKNASQEIIEDLQNKLKEVEMTSEKVIKERDLYQKRASQLESDLETLQNTCSELNLKLDNYGAIEDTLKEREAELSSLHSIVAMKKQEAEECLLSEGEVKSLFEKINGIEMSFEDSELDYPDSHSSANVKKLFYIIDKVVELQHEMETLSRDKEKLQSSLVTHVREIEHLKKEAEIVTSNNQDLENLKIDLTELTLGLKKMIQNMGGNNLVEDKKSVGVKGHFFVLEKMVTDLIQECQTSKIEALELGVKLHGNQKLVDELAAKVTLLEGSIHGRPPPPDTVQERSMFEASSLATTGSEISEINDVSPVGVNTISPVPSAAHVRTMRKGSSEHLALNIDSESDSLIKHPEADDDKGHVFKSLNTSGLIPRQGKLIADRIDGIWVSGGRVLMSQPRARIGLIAYWLFLHIWLLGTIL